MLSAPRRQKPRRFLARASTVVSPASKWGHGRGSSRASEVFVIGECGEDSWVLSGGVSPFSWWFSVGLVSISSSSIVLSSLVWVKSTIGKTMMFISPYETSCIVYSSLMCPERSGMMAKVSGRLDIY